ncbi:MarR family transcriptional regulator [Sphingomonas naphthae]|uniref:MarR family transcriptional regulator n=1 Tax=Sphingomonas naphthae TaxID=1813468 RepID=A0ABY7TQ67_9SPHN|nr:MarR family transcriptional regulator [Sphingomonas naphthae]WCT75090.1 MarR family transcriptional regulator [Sphingomonas naphthae]
MDGETGDGIGLGELDGLIGYHIRRASSVFGGTFVRAVTGTGLRQVPFGILSVVAANPGIKQGAAGRALGIQRANMVALINELVDAGLVDRRAADDDRRAFALSVTPRGAALLEDCTRRIKEQEAELLADFDETERILLIDLVRRIEAREAPTSAD